MSDKTLVERLRDVNSNRAKHPACQIANAVGVGCGGRTCNECGTDTAHALADAIEREYLPRPRFEDGELVREGDTICIDGMLPLKAYWYSVRSDGLTVFSCPTSSRQIKTGERVKRPELEVLDADGVPIRVGDHIWCTPGVHYDGVEYVVTRVTKTSVSYRNAEGEFPSGNCLNEYASRNLTHKQTDSLERVETDIADWCIEHAGKGGSVPVNEWVERIKALLERGR